MQGVKTLNPNEKRAVARKLLAASSPDDFKSSAARELYDGIVAALQGGAKTTNDILAALTPEMFEYAEWVLAAGAADDPLLDVLPAEKYEGHAFESLAALRMLNVRREMADIATVMSDKEPGDPDGTLRLTGRIAELSGYLQRVGMQFPRAANISQGALRREQGGVRPRAPLASLNVTPRQPEIPPDPKRPRNNMRPMLRVVKGGKKR
jgi:hypothetical protein